MVLLAFVFVCDTSATTEDISRNLNVVLVTIIHIGGGVSLLLNYTVNP